MLNKEKFMQQMKANSWEGRETVTFARDLALGQIRTHRNITHGKAYELAAEYAEKDIYCKEIIVEGLYNFYPEQIKEEPRKVVATQPVYSDDPWDFPDEAEDEE